MICCFQRFLEACILHEVFAEYQQRLRMFLCKTTFAENWFWRVAEFDVEMMKMVLPFAWQFGMSFIVFACACSTTNSKPFSTWFLFQQLCGRELLWRLVLYVFHCMLHVSNWKLHVCG